MQHNSRPRQESWQSQSSIKAAANPSWQDSRYQSPAYQEGQYAKPSSRSRRSDRSNSGNSSSDQYIPRQNSGNAASRSPASASKHGYDGNSILGQIDYGLHTPQQPHTSGTPAAAYTSRGNSRGQSRSSKMQGRAGQASPATLQELARRLQQEGSPTAAVPRPESQQSHWSDGYPASLVKRVRQLRLTEKDTAAEKQQADQQCRLELYSTTSVAATSSPQHSAAFNIRSSPRYRHGLTLQQLEQQQQSSPASPSRGLQQVRQMLLDRGQHVFEVGQQQLQRQQRRQQAAEELQQQATLAGMHECYQVQVGPLGVALPVLTADPDADHNTNSIMCNDQKSSCFSLFGD